MERFAHETNSLVQRQARDHQCPIETFAPNRFELCMG